MTWKRAVVVGASGGIGGALADCLQQSGTEVIALSRSATDARNKIDITDEGSIAAVAERIAQGGDVDLVFVASGYLHGRLGRPEKSWRELSADHMAHNFAVNATGPALVAKHFLPLLSRSERTAFAVLSARVGSISDNRLGGWYGYRASKAALNMLVKSLAIELARKRPEAVCVALHPGTVDTALSEPFQRNVAPEKLFLPEYSAKRLLSVLDELTPKDSGDCFAWDGERIDP